MRQLEKRILQDGKVYPGDILKVDSFLNHQIDVEFLDEIASEFFRLFQNEKITRIVTIEASGIAIAVVTARYFKVPVVFAKKAKSSNLSSDVYTSCVHSYTYNKDFTVTITKDYLDVDDHVLIIDDFLANGLAANGLIDIVEQSGATISGIGICVEKVFQGGGQMIRKKGYRLESLAKIKEFQDGKVIFEKESETDGKLHA